MNTKIVKKNEKKQLSIFQEKYNSFFAGEAFALTQTQMILIGVGIVILLILIFLIYRKMTYVGEESMSLNTTPDGESEES